VSLEQSRRTAEAIISRSLARNGADSVKIDPQSASKLADLRQEYLRPDICFAASIRGAVEQMRKELAVLGDDEGTYAAGLRVLKTQGQLAANLATELLERYERSGVE